MLQRSGEPLPTGRLSVAHYLALHRHLFQDVYAWAGRVRTVRISKGTSTFCYPENIGTELARLFAHLRAEQHLHRLSRDAFARASARFLAYLNAIHPFREGNGRTQLSFLTLLADRAGHPLDLSQLDPEEMLRAMIESFAGREERLANVVRGLATAPE